jgi:hypothetical protein
MFDIDEMAIWVSAWIYVVLFSASSFAGAHRIFEWRIKLTGKLGTLGHH